MRAGPEAEFFLFQRRADGEPTTETHDSGGYFDLTPVDLGEDVRREIVLALEQMGFHVEAAHHEVAPGQHEIDFRYDDALIDGRQREHVPLRREERRQPQRPARDVHAEADLRHQRQRHAHASVAVRAAARTRSSTRRREWQLSRTCLHYIGGLLRHAKAFCAITNPLVNSYKRLVPGYEAPTAIAWSERNRSPLVRVPAARGVNTRIELRMPDPSCNPYLALAVMLRAGLDGIDSRSTRVRR